MADKIKILIIYEIIGKPAEHIKKSLDELIENIGENPGIKILSKKVHEPHLIEEKDGQGKKMEIKDLYSTFAEVEFEVDNLDLVFMIVLNTLPSNIEILEPNELRLKNFDLSSVLSNLTIKLHKYDEIAKALSMERQQLIKLINGMNEKIKSLGGESMVQVERESDGGGRVEEKSGESGEEKVDGIGEEEKGKIDKY